MLHLSNITRPIANKSRRMWLSLAKGRNFVVISEAIGDLGGCFDLSQELSNYPNLRIKISGRYRSKVAIPK